MRVVLLSAMVALALAGGCGKNGSEKSGGAGATAPGGDPGGSGTGSTPTDPGSSPAPTPTPAPPAVPRPVVVDVNATGAACHTYEFAVPLQFPDWLHVPDGEDIVYTSNPPAQAPHDEMWAKWDKYTFEVPARYWVHDLQHGGIVILYRPDAPKQVIDALSAAYDALPPYVNPARGAGTCNSNLATMTQDSHLQDTYAVLSWGFMMTSDCVPTTAAVLDFRNRRIDSGAESACADGPYPLRLPCYRYRTAQDSEWDRPVDDGTPVTYSHDPPASGAYYRDMAKYGAYAAVVPRGYWMANVQKGGVAILYRPDAPADVVSGLRAAYAGLPNAPGCSSPVALLTPDPDLQYPWAVVSHKAFMTGQCVEQWAVQTWVTSHHDDPTAYSCDDGTYVPTPGTPVPAPSLPRVMPPTKPLSDVP